MVIVPPSSTLTCDSQVNVGSSVRLSSQDDVSQQQGAAPLSLPSFNNLFEASFVREILRHW
jgi:hypothetical protein